jgi:uncharacterized protein (TIGR02246 family)
MASNGADALLARFATCLERGDTEGAAALFAQDAEYDEPPHAHFAGREAIRAFIADFTARHRRVRYEVVRTLTAPDGQLTAAEWRFSYTRTADGSALHFEGMSWVELRDGLIARWRGFSARVDPAREASAV